MNVTRNLRRYLALSVTALLLLVSANAQATNYTLWIHGRNSSMSTKPGNYTDFSYWGPDTAAAGVNKKAVNWDGVSSISSQNYRITDALDCFCTGLNWCYIAVHSAGDLQIGYALALKGGTTRYKKNASPNATGQCGNTDGTTQTGWNIKWVRVASGASGGSELADLGEWVSGGGLTTDLKTINARALYNHNTTRAVTFYNYAGASGTLYSGMLPGQDDEAVAYHSTGGVSGTSGASFGNPSDWLSNDLTLGTAACEGGAVKWSYHSVSFRDDGEAYNHYASGNWAGIISKVRADVAKNAL